VLVPQPTLEEVLLRVGRLEVRVVELEAENGELRRRLGMNSGNSSKPPSTDGPFGKPAGGRDKAPPVSLRGKSGRKPGGQPGRKGSTLEQVAEPDRRVVHRPSVCGGCGSDLDDLAPVAGEPVRRQVFDLPLIAVEVTEHELYAVKCDCGHLTRAGEPAGVAGPVNIGEGLAAVAVYLSVAQMIPVERITQVIESLYGIKVSAGWVSLVLARAEKAVAEPNEAIKKKIIASPAAFFDESVTKVGGGQAWFHAASTASLTAYHVDECGRGLEAIKAFGILLAFAGVAVHDAYAAYYSASLNGPGGLGTGNEYTHALCIAHLQRELRGIAGHDTVAAEDGWATQADELIENLFRWRRAWSEQGRQRLPGFKSAKVNREWDLLIARALAAHPENPGRGGQSHARRVALRMRQRRDDYLRWTTDFTIPATNNTAEQSVRMIKTKTKVSGGFRTLPGLAQFLAIRGYIDTSRKHHRHIITDLRNALTGNPWIPAT